MPRGTPFQPGNKFGHGRPKGSKNKIVRTATDIVREHAEQIIKRAVANCYRGDKTSTGILLKHLLKQSSPVRFKLASTDTSAAILENFDRILKAMSKGDLPYQEAQNLISGLTSKLGVMENVDQDRRIDALEAALKIGSDLDSDAHKIVLDDEEAA